MNMLDASQIEFCQAPVGNIRLLAPAGCGKTLCLLHRCKHLSETQGRARFLIVTFTVAAKQELAARVNEDAQFAGLRDSVEITTLNAWGWRRLRETSFNPKLITSRDDYHFTMLNQLQGVWQNYDAVKESVQKRRSSAPRDLMNLIDTFKSLGFDHERHITFEAFSEHIDWLHQQGLTWRVYEQFGQLVRLDILDGDLGNASPISEEDRMRVYGSFFEFWRAATEHLISNATFTLEDQKYAAYLDERNKLGSGSILRGAARRDHVLVDEFQDINPLDLALVKAIATRNRATVTIAGDDDQAIFEWRGATPDYILEPEKFFGAKFDTHILETNYRSPANVVDLSQKLIQNNSRRVNKKIAANSSDNALIEVRSPGDLLETMGYVHRLVQEASKTGSSPSRIALIGRKRAQIIPYQVYFASQDVPFCAAEDLQIFLSGAFDRLLELLEIRADDSRAARRRSVDNAIKLCNLAKRYPLSRADRESVRSHLVRANPRSLAHAANALAEYSGRLKGPNNDGAMSKSMADAIRRFLNADTVSETLLALSEEFEGLQFDLGKAEDDIFFIDPPFAQLAEFAWGYGDDYDKFIDDIERAKEQLTYIPPYEENPKDEVWRRPLHLMTALRAKGKEFDTVVLLDVHDDMWPSKYAVTEAQLEAERRVFYVAFTRARKRVVILLNNRFGPVSPYIGELGLRG